MYELQCFNDYGQGLATTFPNKTTSIIDLPNSNVLYFELSEDAWCCVRPSGTEPKIKIYTGVKGNGFADADEKLEALTNSIAQIVQGV